MNTSREEKQLTQWDEKKKSVKCPPKHFWWIVLMALVLPTVFTLLIFKRCNSIAGELGTVAGRAVGSWHGVTEGIEKGAEAGKAEGLSAKDTEAEVTTKMKETKKLEVLLVDLRLTDLYQQGHNYAAIFGIHGEGVFTVDLTQSQAVYNAERNQITITIPEPEFIPYLDDSSLEIIAEYKHPLFNGSTKDGYHGYLNSRKITDERVQSELSGYDALVEQAKASALEQVGGLARSICGSDAFIDVQFAEVEA